MIKKVFLGSIMFLILIAGIVLGNTAIPRDYVSDTIGDAVVLFGGRIKFENLNEIDNFFYGEEYFNQTSELSDLNDKTFHYIYTNGYERVESYATKIDDEYVVFSKLTQKGAVKGYEYIDKEFIYTFDRDYKMISKTENSEDALNKYLLTFTKYNYGLNVMLADHSVTLVHPSTGVSFEYGLISDYYDRTTVVNISKDIFEFQSYVGYDSVKSIPGNKISGKLNLKRNYSEVYVFSDLAGTTLTEYTLSEWLNGQTQLPSYIVSCLANI